MITKIMEWASITALLLVVSWRPVASYQIPLDFVVCVGSVMAVLITIENAAETLRGHKGRSETKTESNPNMQLSTPVGSTMPVDSHHRAAEYHELAAHAHRAAAAHHGKKDHQTGHEHSKQALKYSNQASQWSQEAHRKSEKSTGKP
jgi:hypothetical protein